MFNLKCTENAKVWTDYVWEHGLNNQIPPPPAPAPVEQPKLPEETKAIEAPSQPLLEETSAPEIK